MIIVIISASGTIEFVNGFNSVDDWYNSFDDSSVGWERTVVDNNVEYTFTSEYKKYFVREFKMTELEG